jgi:mono/diheme cytochrome c family protein
MRSQESGIGRTGTPHPLLITALVFLLLLLMAACSQKMRDQPKLNPDESTAFFGNGTSSQVPVSDTVPRGYARDDVQLFTGKDAAGNDVTELPFPVNRQDLLRGKERFEIYCAPCHGRIGNGLGVVVQRGFVPPPTFHQDRLRNAPVGHFYDVITNGLAPMPSYANQIPVRDRWLIIAYIRVLQFSQNVNVNNLTPAERQAVEAGQ